MATSATSAEKLILPPDFRAELLYSVPFQTQGSWVSLTHDDQGRLIASDQYGKLYRVTPPPIGTRGDAKVEAIELEIGMAQGLLYAFDSLYVMVNGRGSGLYRVRDTDGDDAFDEVKLLRAIPGGGEHGPHAVILGPRGKSLYISAGNHTDLPNPEKSLVPRNWDEDLLLPRMWDARGHAAGKLAPGGWICRTDPQAKTLELVSIGFRNEYDIAFNPAGDLFTYDADMEWDVGTPWYRPTRVLHVTSGSEFGWRSGTGKWPAWYPDSLPAVVDIGPGSPTGIVFGTGAKFPAKFQRALFISDWSYGVIYAVHMRQQAGSYTGTAERFVTAAPLPVTDLVVNPLDGALYFAIGGRKTQSGLYRVTYVGKESVAAVTDEQPLETGKLRRRLEAFHVRSQTPGRVIEEVWPQLNHVDRHVRYAARIAIEHQPIASWQSRVLGETRPLALITATIALARQGDKTLQPSLIEALGRIDWASLDQSQQLALLRAYGLIFVRMGTPGKADRRAVIQRLDAVYPASTSPLNRELSQLLIYLEAPGVVAKTLQLLSTAPTQEEQIHYGLSLRSLRTGWTLEDRRAYFQWFNTASAHRGGASFLGFLRNIRNEAIQTLTAVEKTELAEVLAAAPAPEQAPVTPPRKFVRKWTVEELLPAVEAGLDGRDLQRGRQTFAAASCFKCHRFSGEGGANGPDLTGVRGRFNPLNLLESIIEPSKTISDQYQATSFVLKNGKTVSGRVVNLSGNRLMLTTDMLQPGDLTTIERDDIDLMSPSTVSMMPTGLLETFSKDEILDLVAYLRSGVKPPSQ